MYIAPSDGAKPFKKDDMKMKRILSLLLVLVVLTLALASCGEDPVLIYEERSTVTATKGIDYDIDYVKVSITDKASGNGDVTYMDYDDFC